MVKVKELLNLKTFVRNLIASLILGIILPILLQSFLFSKIEIFSLELPLIIGNGIILVIFYTTYGLFKKHTLIRLVLGIVFIILQIYFFTVGNNPFTLYLPQDQFAQLSISIPSTELSFKISFFYGWILLPYFILKFLNLIRHYIKEDEEWQLKISPFKSVQEKRIKKESEKKKGKSKVSRADFFG
jgi:hypothetical protein